MTLANATQDTTGDCATATSKFEGNQDGGICLGSTGVPKVSLAGIPVRGGASYRIGVLGKRHADYRSSGQTDNVPPPGIEVLWSNGASTGSNQSDRTYDTTT